MDCVGLHQAALTQVLAAWNKAMAAWDSIGVAEIYAENALFVGSLPGLRRGRGGVREYFSSIPGRYVQLSYKDKKIVSLTESCFIVSGVAVFTQEISGTEAELQRRLSLTLQKSGSQWFIALHHVSLIPPEAGEFLY